jgi:hypothetical protein
MGRKVKMDTFVLAGKRTATTRIPFERVIEVEAALISEELPQPAPSMANSNKAGQSRNLL